MREARRLFDSAEELVDTLPLSLGAIYCRKRRITIRDDDHVRTVENSYHIRREREREIGIEDARSC